MSKQTQREEAERLIREAMERKTVKVTQADTKIEPTCGKCGAKNKVSLAPGQSRTTYTCKECGHQQTTL
jgi:transcription elongation factor Elf1